MGGRDNPGIQNFVFAALFPVNLMIILLTGGVLFTGASAIVPAAVYEGKAHWLNIPKVFAVSWLGNVSGAVVFALLLEYCDMNEGLTAQLAMKVAAKKVSKDFLTTFIKGIGCNWLVCMAVFLCGQAQDMTGKFLGIWFPISCFVAIGFEHIPANMFMIPLGLLAGADVSVADMIIKNFIPVTLGNAFAGMCMVAGGYSYAFGKFGGNSSSILPLSRCSQEDLAIVEKGESKAPAHQPAKLDQPAKPSQPAKLSAMDGVVLPQADSAQAKSDLVLQGPCRPSQGPNQKWCCRSLNLVVFGA